MRGEVVGSEEPGVMACWLIRFLFRAARWACIGQGLSVHIKRGRSCVGGVG